MHLAPLPACALKLNAHGSGEAAVVVGDDQINATEPTCLEPAEEVRPTLLRFAVSQLQPQDFTVPFCVDTGSDERATGAHPSVLAHFDHERIHDEEGIVARA